jgi:transposase
VQLLNGSLLGDGGMDAPSIRTARFHEGHCQEQLDYVQWKALLLKPFTTKVSPTKKTASGKEYLGNTVYTHACPQFRPFYEAFYPAPDRVRKFPSDLHERMTPFALAVWYMDDGNLTYRAEPRISFGLDQASLDRVLKALRVLGLSPKVYGEGSGIAIHFPQQRVLFRSLIEPHLIPCMQYKLPVVTEGQERHRKSREISSEKVRQLYEGGLSAGRVAELCGVGESTVSRKLALVGVQKRKSGPQRGSLASEDRVEILQAYDSKKWSTLSTTEQDRWVAEVFRFLRDGGFPFPPLHTSEEARVILGQVREAGMALREGRIDPIRVHGISLCNGLFPDRFKASSKTAKYSAYEAWHIDDLLKKAIRFQFKVGDPVVPNRVLRAVTMNCRTPSIFRPTVARFIFEQYCPSGGAVWDPCSGYGGRLLGALAAGVGYVGTDVDEATVQGNRELAALLGAATQAEVHCTPAEKFDPPKVDLVFTSPPYFDQERYSGDSKQSWKKHGESLQNWLNGFLRPVVATAARVSPRLVLNVADVKGAPLVAETRRVAQEEGWTLTEELRFPLPKLNRVDPWEPVLVFEKLSG